MTHGDKKAKTGKTSQASGKKSSKAAAVSKEKGGSRLSVKKEQASRAEAAAPRKGAGEKSRAAVPAKGSAGATDETFSNPVVGSAFRRAIETWSGAFRRLTD